MKSTEDGIYLALIEGIGTQVDSERRLSPVNGRSDLSINARVHFFHNHVERNSLYEPNASRCVYLNNTNQALKLPDGV